MDAGAVASPGTPVATIVQLRAVKVNMAVPEADINRLKPGDPATVRVPSLGQPSLAGRIDVVSPVADAQSHTFQVSVLLPNPGVPLKPGMTAQVSFGRAAYRTGSAAALVYLRAVQVDERGHHSVYLVQGRTARWHEVQTGDLVGDGLAVTSGLTTQDRVVVEGCPKLYDQAPVKVLN